MEHRKAANEAVCLPVHRGPLGAECHPALRTRVAIQSLLSGGSESSQRGDCKGLPVTEGQETSELPWECPPGG